MTALKERSAQAKHAAVEPVAQDDVQAYLMMFTDPILLSTASAFTVCTSSRSADGSQPIESLSLNFAKIRRS